MRYEWPDILIFGVIGLVGLLVGALIIGGIFEVLDRCIGTTVTKDGTVKEKHYTPASSSTGTGVGPNGSGGVAVVITQSYVNAAWTLLVDLDGFDEMQPIEVEARHYKLARAGLPIKVNFTLGAFSRSLYGPTGYRLND